MIFVSFAEAVSMYLVFFQEQRKTFLPLEKQYVIIVRKRSVAFSRKFFFFGQLQYGKSIIFFCLVICMSCVF